MILGYFEVIGGCFLGRFGGGWEVFGVIFGVLQDYLQVVGGVTS